ncbi:MAG: nitroreductase family protein [Acidimicrobiaceae bacterium]|nr:nitroreductase family protein [Acidimicrobiaceae bacterium]
MRCQPPRALGGASMDFQQAVRSRRMVRSFTSQPVEPSLVDEICELARRAPSAGNTDGLEFLVLEGDATETYWDVTLPADRRSGFAWPGLLNAPVLVVMWTDPGAYLARYREPDKARTPLGAGVAAWPVPYWFVDSGAAMMTMLLAAQERGLGTAFFGMFDHVEAVRAAFGVPQGRLGVGTVAIGHRRSDDRPSRSAARRRRPLGEVLHRGHW